MAKVRGLNAQILQLALPTLGALIAEPLFLIADTAIVGHLGIAQLGGVGLSATVLQTAIGLLIFLAYGTTPAVARLLGAGRHTDALAAGKNGLWLAVFLGFVLAAVGVVTGATLLRWMGASGDVFQFAQAYLIFSLPGLPAMLLVLAATGVLRGLQDAKTPLVIAVSGFALNALLNFALVYGAHWGVAGSAIGTSLTQWVMALAYLWVLLPQFRAAGVSLAPQWGAIVAQMGTGGWLFLRTLALRAALVTLVTVATSTSATTLAGLQIVLTLFNLMAFALDAIAIAAQSLIGKELGAGNVKGTQNLTRRMVLWGICFGVFTGVVLAVTAPWVSWLFTTDPAMPGFVATSVLILALAQPICGVVFVLDGVLIGAGDGRYLAIVSFVGFAIFAILVALVQPHMSSATNALALLWSCFALGYMCVRAMTLLLRVRTTAWQRVGAQSRRQSKPVEHR